MRLKLTLIGIVIVLVSLHIRACERHRAYTRAQQACQAYAREHVPDVDPVAWCAPFFSLP